MQTKKIIGIALAASLVASMATVAVFATPSADQVKPFKTLGVIGGFNEWGGDVEMTDEDGDGVFEATVEVTGEYDFKVRADGAWDTSWGVYEEEYDRTQNSQTNCHATVAEGQKLVVKLDTTKVDDAAKANAESYVNEDGFNFDEEGFDFWPVTFEVTGDTVETDDEPIETVDEPVETVDEPVEESSEEPVEESSEEPVEESSEEPTVDPVATDDEPVETVDEPTDEPSRVVPTDVDVVPADNSTVNPDGTTTDATNTADKGKVVVETQDEPANGDSGDNAGKNGSNNGSTSSGSGSVADAPATGDAAMAAAFIAVLTAALGAVVLATKKKRI